MDRCLLAMALQMAMARVFLPYIKPRIRKSSASTAMLDLPVLPFQPCCQSD
jgi:hypothetical protein